MYDKLTEKDIALMQAELDDRRLNIRPKIMEEVKRCRAYGDLSENYEYKAAKQEQRQNDSRMRYLENMIRTAQVVKEDFKGDGIGLYDRVSVRYPDEDEEEVFQIVSTVRIDPDAGRISLDSPIGKALLGRKAGDRVTVRLEDGGSYELDICSVERSEDDGSAPLTSY